MADYLIQDTTLDAIADAINAKTGGTSAMTPAEMVTAIGSISGGGTDISPYKVVRGTITPSANSSTLTFPCGDITVIYYLAAKVVDYATYINAENNDMGLGRAYCNWSSYFNRTWVNSAYGHALAVYKGAFDYWTANSAPRIDRTNHTAKFVSSEHSIFRAGLAIEYVIVGV